MVNITKRNFIGLHTLFAILSAILGAVVLHFVLRGNYFSEYPIIPVYFYLFGLLSIYLFDECRLRTPRKLLLLYLVVKMVKLIFSILLIFIYYLVVREDIKTFLLTFLSFYLIYLIFETWLFFYFELNRKLKKKNKKNNETIA